MSGGTDNYGWLGTPTRPMVKPVTRSRSHTALPTASLGLTCVNTRLISVLSVSVGD
ncbi:hypothetical protein STRTUCAR8_03681 [Streptomyces turgidiscabies Car8]|uniref:Uncharacterized protein n=1 Tax=Streptomyces turgidiscabies (strain Car8) TaxID=698760 RepID=L7EPW9_STRT8|nr:hypothetical protein STRTUCAR8_03681 [Streptomyces turgidiscabies Car8]